MQRKRLVVTLAELDPWRIAIDYFDPPGRSYSALEQDWRTWLRVLLGQYLGDDFAPHHAQFWEWVWSIEPGERPETFVGVWPRGGAKSTSAEAACVALGAMGKRRYGLYVGESQEQADDHVANVAGMLESPAIEREYPELASRMVGKYGNSKGWRRNRLRTSSGFTLDAIGLDTAARGVKLDEFRPDFMVFDDLDGEQDTPAATAKKIRALTRKLIPAGSPDLAVLAIQNLVHERSIFARLAGVADEPADFLTRRIVSGPIPAIEGLVTEADASRVDGGYRIVEGEATWSGQPVERCQEMLDDMGLSAFLAECQHDTEPPAGGMFSHLDFDSMRCTLDAVPLMVRTVVWVDPAVTNTDDSDSQGIQADGLGTDGKVYRLWSFEQRTTPLDALMKAIRKAIELGADTVGVETDQGGDTWESVWREALALVLAEMTPAEKHRLRVLPSFAWNKAGQGHGPKTHRAGLMLAQYERNRFVHVIGPTTSVLERALRRFPKTKPLDLVDSCYWASYDLLGAELTEGRVSKGGLEGSR